MPTAATTTQIQLRVLLHTRQSAALLSVQPLALGSVPAIVLRVGLVLRGRLGVLTFSFGGGLLRIG